MLGASVSKNFSKNLSCRLTDELQYDFGRTCVCVCVRVCVCDPFSCTGLCPPPPLAVAGSM